MNAIANIYYYGYIFYTKVIGDNEPHATTVFTLSFCEALLITATIEIIAARFYCRHFGIGIWSVVMAVLFIANYLFFVKMKKGTEIVRSKAAVLQKSKISVFLAISFYVFANSILFWEPILIKCLLGNC